MFSTDRFRVETVEVASPPAGIENADSMPTWCRYVVANRTSRVVGRYCGSLAQARLNAERLATGFNDRARSNYSPWSPRYQAKRRSAVARRAPNG